MINTAVHVRDTVEVTRSAYPNSQALCVEFGSDSVTFFFRSPEEADEFVRAIAAAEVEVHT